MEPKFKPGMKVWSVRHGVVELNSTTHFVDGVKISIPDGGYYLPDGRYGKTDLLPSLYTLEEARKMGFPVPEEPTVIWVNIMPGIPRESFAACNTDVAARKAASGIYHSHAALKFVEVKE